MAQKNIHDHNPSNGFRKNLIFFCRKIQINLISRMLGTHIKFILKNVLCHGMFQIDVLPSFDIIVPWSSQLRSPKPALEMIMSVDKYIVIFKRVIEMKVIVWYICSENYALFVAEINLLTFYTVTARRQLLWTAPLSSYI